MNKLQMFHQFDPSGETFVGKNYHFYCPGCRTDHSFLTDRVDGGRPCWTFDGNIFAPTFSPSLLIRGCLNHKGIAVGGDDVCHTFVRAGRIEFLGDCTHALAGKTVDLPDYPDRGRGA